MMHSGGFQVQVSVLALLSLSLSSQSWLAALTGRLVKDSRRWRRPGLGFRSASKLAFAPGLRSEGRSASTRKQWHTLRSTLETSLSFLRSHSTTSLFTPRRSQRYDWATLFSSHRAVTWSAIRLGNELERRLPSRPCLSMRACPSRAQYAIRALAALLPPSTVLVGRVGAWVDGCVDGWVVCPVGKGVGVGVGASVRVRVRVHVGRWVGGWVGVVCDPTGRWVV
jgi:hypothetical protein